MHQHPCKHTYTAHMRRRWPPRWMRRLLTATTRAACASTSNSRPWPHPPLSQVCAGEQLLLCAPACAARAELRCKLAAAGPQRSGSRGAAALHSRLSLSPLTVRQHAAPIGLTVPVHSCPQSRLAESPSTVPLYDQAGQGRMPSRWPASWSAACGRAGLWTSSRWWCWRVGGCRLGAGEGEPCPWLLLPRVESARREWS